MKLRRTTPLEKLTKSVKIFLSVIERYIYNEET